MKNQLRFRLPLSAAGWIGASEKLELTLTGSELEPLNKFCRWEANIVGPKFNFIQRINGQENLAIPGNSWVNNWEKKSGHDTRDGSHATLEGNSLASYTRDAQNIDCGGRLIWRQSRQVVRQYSNAFIRGSNTSIESVMLRWTRSHEKIWTGSHREFSSLGIRTKRD